ncbi:hypothetical protein V5R04_12690 [Jonesiaceae bacterium BS-20]|uniref:Thioredoxin family protein n=1 Tax=Jonesiaceae bacterium BS-20 TaxID=3120821 RepID=A0AAU7DVL6_9MICO
MDFQLFIIDDCPNSQPAASLLARALEAEGMSPNAFTTTVVATDAQAQELGFHGSPTFAHNRTDLFPSATAPAVSCRLYQTTNGIAGLPTLEALRAAIRPHLV